MTAGDGERRYVLAVDLGTSGPKVALVGTDGCLVGAEYEPTELLLTADGGVEQDPEGWWTAVVTATRRLLEPRPVPVEHVAGVCCTAQWLGTVAVDGGGRHLGNAIIWMDARGARHARELTRGRLRVNGYDLRKGLRWVRRTGGAPGHSGKDPVAHILFLRDADPARFAATRTFLEPKDYLNLRLTGRVVATFDSIAAHWVTDNRDLARIGYDAELLALSRLDQARLPDLVRAVDVVGTLLPGPADELGIPPGLPVVGGTPDVQSATLGSGAVADFRAHVYLGTSSWITCHVPFKKTDLFHSVASLPSAIPDRYFVADDQETAGACLVWLRDRVLWPRDELAASPPPSDAFRRIDALAGTAPVGSHGVVFTPWLHGERTPVDDRRIRASWTNLSLHATRADLCRAALEGVAYNSAWLLRTVERFVGRRLNPIRAVGGGAASELWCQIHADVLDRTIEQVRDPQHANVRGAGILGAVGLGFGTFAELARNVEVAGRHEPDPARVATYRPLARELRRLYKATRPVHARLNR